MWGGYGGYGWGMGGGIGMIIAILFWTVLLIAVVVIAISLVRKSGSSQPLSPKETALDILKQRYAHGDIGKQEFEEKKRDLQI